MYNKKQFILDNIKILKKIFKNNKFLEYIQESFDNKFYYRTKHYLSDKNISINKYIELYGNGGSTIVGVDVGVILEDVIIESLQKFIKDYHIEKDINQSRGDIIFNNIISWELKTRRYIQSESSTIFQGSTHSSSKSGNLILLIIDLDQDQIPIYKFNKIMKGLSLLLLDNSNNLWIGEAKDNSSRTTLKISIDFFNKNREVLILGDFKLNKKYVKFIPKMI